MSDDLEANGHRAMTEREQQWYRFVTSQIQYFEGKITDVFKEYVKLVSAIAGAYVLVRIPRQPPVPQAVLNLDDIFSLARYLVLAVGICYGLLILLNARSWWGYRVRESALMPGVPRPQFRSVLAELCMIALIFAITILGWTHIG